MTTNKTKKILKFSDSIKLLSCKFLYQNTNKGFIKATMIYSMHTDEILQFDIFMKDLDPFRVKLK